jgi:hypothetical protein
VLLYGCAVHTDYFPDLCPAQDRVLFVWRPDDALVFVTDFPKELGTFRRPLISRHIDEPERQLFVRHVSMFPMRCAQISGESRRIDLSGGSRLIAEQQVC